MSEERGKREKVKRERGEEEERQSEAPSGLQLYRATS